MHQNEYLWSKGLIVNDVYVFLLLKVSTKQQNFADDKLNVTEKMELDFCNDRKHSG